MRNACHYSGGYNHIQQKCSKASSFVTTPCWLTLSDQASISKMADSSWLSQMLGLCFMKACFFPVIEWNCPKWLVEELADWFSKVRKILLYFRLSIYVQALQAPGYRPAINFYFRWYHSMKINKSMAISWLILEFYESNNWKLSEDQFSLIAIHYHCILNSL